MSFFYRKHILSLFCSHGADNARGVAILIRNNFDCVVEETVVDTNGIFIILKVILKGEQAVLVNLYGPDRDNKLVDFYHLVLQSLKQNDFDEIENIIMGGDFNCPLNPIIDKRGGNLIRRRSVINTIESLQSELDLHDIWRVKNPTRRAYPKNLKAGLDPGLWTLDPGLWTLDSGLWTLDSGLFLPKLPPTRKKPLYLPP